MLTILLAFINAKYKHDYQILFVFTFFLDIFLIDLAIAMIKGG